MLEGAEEPVELPWSSSGFETLIATVMSAQDEVLIGIHDRLALLVGLQKAESKFPMVETRQCITRWPHHSFNCVTKIVGINLSFMIRLILEKEELSCSPSRLRRYVHTLGSFMEIHIIGFDPVITAGQFD